MRTFLKLSTASIATLQATPNSQNMIARSTSNSDTMAAAILGYNLVPASATGSVTLTGQIEVETAEAWSSLTRIALASAPVGAVSFRRQGTAAGCALTVATVPTEGQTLIVGLVGQERTYTFRSPCRATIVCPAGSALVTGASPASYVKVSIAGTAHYFWFSNGTNSDPAPGGTGHSVTWDATDTVIAASLNTAINALVGANFLSTVSTTTVTITGILLGALTLTQDAGADFTLTVVQAGTAVAANQIRALYHTDGAVASIANICSYIDATIDHSGTNDTEYSTGTTAHAHLAAAASSPSVNLTDRLACNRYLGWSALSGTAISSLNFSSTTIVGGVDGPVICEIAPAQLGAGSILTLDSTTVDNLPAAYLVTLDAIQTFGRNARLWLKKDSGGGAAVDFSVRGGPDADHLLELDTLSTSGATIVPSDVLQGCEFVQVAITSNDDGGAVYAALVY